MYISRLFLLNVIHWNAFSKLNVSLHYKFPLEHCNGETVQGKILSIVDWYNADNNTSLLKLNTHCRLCCCHMCSTVDLCQHPFCSYVLVDILASASRACSRCYSSMWVEAWICLLDLLHWVEAWILDLQYR